MIYLGKKDENGNILTCQSLSVNSETPTPKGYVKLTKEEFEDFMENRPRPPVVNPNQDLIDRLNAGDSTAVKEALIKILGGP